MKTAASIAFLIAMATITVACVYGWALNILAITHLLSGPVTALFVARCVGVVVAPLGVVLGLFV